MKKITKPEYKLLPCIFCTIGFNCYVAGHKAISSTYQKITNKQKNQTTQGESKQQQ